MRGSQLTVPRPAIPLYCLLCVVASINSVPAAPPAELKIQSGHTGSINSVAFSPDGRRIITGSQDKTARLWDVETASEIRRFVGHTGPVSSVAFSPDGRAALTGSADGTVRLWDVDTGREIRRFAGHSVGVSSVAFSPDGLSILSGSRNATVIQAPGAPSADNTARLWDVATGREIRRFEGNFGGVGSLSFSPDGRSILTGCGDGTVRLWDLATGRETSRFKANLRGLFSNDVNSVAFSPDGRSVLTGSAESEARLWDVATGRQTRSFDGHGEVHSVALSPDGRWAIVSGFEKTALWEVATGREVRRLVPGATAFSRDGRWALTGTEMWEVTTGHTFRNFEGHSSAVSSAALSPDGRSLLIGSLGKPTPLWDLVTGREVRRYEGTCAGGVFCSVPFSPNGRSFIAYRDNAYWLWDLATGKTMRTLEDSWSGPGHPIFSSDGGSILDGGLLWDAATGRRIGGFDGSAAISPDRRSAVKSEWKRTYLWDPATGSETHLLAESAVNALVFSPDGRQLAGSIGDTARVWNVATGNQVHSFQGHSAVIYLIAFSPDGRLLLTGSGDNSARLWDVATGRVIHRLEGHLDDVRSVSFSPSGRMVLTGSADGTCKFWDAGTGRLLVTLISFRDGGWAVVDPEGRYDAADPENSTGLYWQLGDDVIELRQLKKRFYTPNLLARTLGFNEEPLPNVAGLNQLQPWPEVQVSAPQPGQSLATIRITDRGGGIGRLVVRVNGREMPLATRGTAIKTGTPVKLDLSGAELRATSKNTIEVIAYGKSNLVAGRGVKVAWEKAPENAAAPPALHAVIVGISDYAGQSMSLRFPAKDALEMAHALELGARRMFGVERTDIALFATGTGHEPTKENIRRAFESIPARSGPSDVVLIYLAGHGVAGRAGSDLYYYLTRDARTLRPEDDALLWDRTTISSAELLEWLRRKGMPLNQVVVLDTCAAGAATTKLIQLADRRGLTGDQRRAIELLKDANNGSHILMGAAADKVSYEASRYGQGLLTYSLLLGMRGEALDEGGRLDVAKWFFTAQLRVPEFAQGIGGIQQPVIRSGGQTFPIAMFTPEDRGQIRLSSLKPQLLRASVHDDDDNDPLQLDGPVRAALRAASVPATRGEARPEPPLVYLDQVAGDVAGAYVPQVRYQVSGSTVQIRLRLVSGQDRVERKFESPSLNPTELGKRVAEEFVQLLAALKPK